MKNRYFKAVAITLSAALLLTGTSLAMQDVSAKDQEDEVTEATEKTVEEIDESLESNDTFYVFTNADGTANKIMASDGAEGFAEAELTEETEKKLPVSMKIEYKLNGKKVTPEELAGQSGQLSMDIKYINNQYEFQKIKGEKVKIYVPFTVVTGMMLSNDVFQNVEINNGKLVDDGDKTMIAGIAMPGLQTTLNLDKDKLEIPENIHITADVTDFEMVETMTIVTSEMFKDLDVDNVESIEELESSLNTLEEAMTQLLDGSSQLYEGLDMLFEKSGELEDGVGQLAAGSDALVAGASTLDSAMETMNGGIETLSTGLDTLNDNSAAIRGGADQVFQSLLSTATAQLTEGGVSVPALTIGNYSDVLTGVINSLDSEAVYQQVYQAVSAAVEAQRQTVQAAVTEAVKAAVTEEVTKAFLEQQQSGGQDPQAPEGGDASNGALTEEQIQALIQQTVEQKMQTAEVQQMITSQTDAKVQQLIAEKMESPEIQAQLSAASEGAQKVIAVKTMLDSYNGFYLGIFSYTDGVATAAAGAQQLSEGAASMKEGTTSLLGGAQALDEGIDTLGAAAPQLVEGVSQLKDGSMQLSEGLGEFNEKGISKITKAARDDVGTLIDRVKAAVNLAKKYEPFNEEEDGMSTPVRFVYRTEKIEK